MVGRIVRPHGVRGEAVVEPLSDNPSRFDPGSRLLLTAPERGPAAHPALTVSTARPHKGRLLVTFDEVEDREAVEALRGHWLEVPRGDGPGGEEGSFYFFELVECRCIDRSAGELGTVQDVIEDGGGLLLEVHGDRGRLLVPFVTAYLVLVDVADRRIEVDLPEGLIEACISKS